MAASHIFKVIFDNQGKVFEIYARKVSHGSLFGFIEVEELIFGERSSVVVDPAEEKIQAEFAGVKRTYLPLHSVLRIDEVQKPGVSKVSARSRAATSPSFRSPCTPRQAGPATAKSRATARPYVRARWPGTAGSGIIAAHI